jgi:hypothetical protein
MWASRRVRQKENATAFRFISLGSRAGQSRGAAFLKGKAAFAAVLDLMMRKWNRFGGVLVCLLCLYCSELSGLIWQVLAIRFPPYLHFGKIGRPRLKEIMSFSSGSQNKSSSQAQSRPRWKGNGEFRASTHVAISVRSKDAKGDDFAEIEPAEQGSTPAMLRRPDPARPAKRGRGLLSLGKLLFSCRALQGL